MSGWDQRDDIEALEAQMRALDGRESLDSESAFEVTRIRRMYDDARRRLGLLRPGEGDD